MVRNLSPEKREQFLAAALRLFVENGVAHTSTAEIARAAGTAAGTLFLYFPTKQDLIHALVLKISREHAAAITARLDTNLSAYDTFLRIWQGTVGWFSQHLTAYRYVQQVRDSGIIADAVVEESNQNFGYYYRAIQKGLEEGSLKPYPPELIGGLLYQDIVGVMNLILGQADPTRREEISRQGFEIFWNGIKNETESQKEQNKP